MARQLVPTAGRITKLELARRIAVETAATEIATSVASVGALQQARVEEIHCVRNRFVQAILALTVLRDVCVVVPQLNTGAHRKPLHCADEVKMLDLTHERDRITALLATKTKIGAHLGVHGEA